MMGKTNGKQQSSLFRRKELKEIETPMDWISTNDWDSHRPLLYLVISKIPHETFYEFGMGYGSTPILAHWYNEQAKELYSFENNKEWFDKFTYGYIKGLSGISLINKHHSITYREDILHCDIFEDSIVFIDCAPGEIRKDFIEKFRNKAKVLIVHDSEPESDYVYQIAYLLNTFKYRIDYKPLILPYTTAVSNFVDVTKII